MKVADPKGPEPKTSRRWSSDFGPFLTAGLQLGVAVAFFFGVGYWLDGKFGTGPWGSLAGALIGVIGGSIKFLKEALQLSRKADEEYRRLHATKHSSED